MVKCYRKLAGQWHVEGECECEAALQAGWQDALFTCEQEPATRRGREGSCHLVDKPTA